MGSRKADVTNITGTEHGVVISWEGDMGFGNYTIYTNSAGHIVGDSEYMDKGENKEFLKSLFASIVEQIDIVG